MSRGLTPGQEALREAARLEAARYYGAVCRGHEPVQPVSVVAAVAEAELTARQAAPEHAPEHAPDVDDVDLIAAVREGLANHEIIARTGCTYAEVRAARKHAMGSVA